MNATTLDLRKNMKKVLAAIDRNETITLTHRGRQKAIIISCAPKAGKSSAADHAAFGIWADRKDLEEVDSFVRNLRKGRF